ncbi:hypothetical protein MKS88_004524 [Plasmodium brasilianum]|uniref:Uncharacterized protein n=2 Tax=Plasmodium (Plasmodium) TaxID=418103 RepID=A0A1A8W9F4_PLAMA|nr:conserved Plasmodium protein, unknown function [Plasmodium malariae]KAI4836721.1 hypothetical protein MKS88_004524 [Plasmodium brasilianum]SBS88604.1 conserved Plasmodium protein, unknown function [Plasmodium malariae]SBT80372.1 conserved Plasmodium protein, unknown function [Plasmodium malariae]SCO94009.1 conserved Plasmodium protein, unknown function [Plasmodium malariae]
MKESVKKKFIYENEKIYVIYDEIYDTYRKEKRGRNYYQKIIRYPNPLVLIVRVLTELYNLKDKVEYISCSSYEIIKPYSYFNGEKKSIYETLFLIYSMNNKNDLQMENSYMTIDSDVCNGDRIIPSKNIAIGVHMDIRLFHILSEFHDIYEYFLFLYKNCYENYTRQFFINSNYNILKGYIKLYYMTNYINKKFRNISFDTILNKFIKLLNIFIQGDKNYLEIEYIIFYVYFYVFLNIPMPIYPWDDNSRNDILSRKILKDGNINTIISQVQSSKNNFFSYIINNSTIDTNGYYETCDFNIAILLINEKEVKNSALINGDSSENVPNKKQYNFFFEKKDKYINLNEYILYKNIGYNSLKQFYKPHFYYLTILKKMFVFHNKMKIMQYFFHESAIRVVDMDKYYKYYVKGG